MTDTEIIQGSPEWKAARCGSLGASQIHDALARTKSGWGASRANLMAALIAERLTGVPQDTFTSAAMQWGSDIEPDARLAYEFHADADVVQVGLVRHPTIAGTHASPDGLVGEYGLLEIKCPNSATHLDTLLGEALSLKYLHQAQWQMACLPERRWVDHASFDPRLPETMRLHVRRVARDDAMIADMEREARVFLAELDEKMARLNALFGVAA